MPNRFRPDPELASSASALMQRLAERGALVDGAWLRSVQAALPRDVIAASFARCGADEGTLWLVRGSVLVPAFNTGAHAASLVDLFEQPIERGIIGMVAVTEQAFCENDIGCNTVRDSTLDTQLGVVTTAMMAVPLAFAGALRGVVSCVQLAGTTSSPGFSPQHLETFERDVNVAGRLLDLALLESVMGLASA